MSDEHARNLELLAKDGDKARLYACDRAALIAGAAALRRPQPATCATCLNHESAGGAAWCALHERPVVDEDFCSWHMPPPEVP